MALKKTPPRKRRLQLAKAWIPTYTGKNIVKGYRKHFGLSPLAAVADLKLLGYEFSTEYIEALKRDQVNRSRKKKSDSEPSCDSNEYDFFDDFCHEQEAPKKIRRFKNHVLVGGKLLQTNKRFSQLKESQKSLISGWLRDEYKDFYESNKKFPSSSYEIEEILDAVYEKIQERDIWIPFEEVSRYFNSRQTRYKNKLMKK